MDAKPALADAVRGMPIEVPLRGVPAEADGERVPNELFDRDFYRSQYADLGDVDPREHFAQIGRAQGAAPSVGAVYLADAIRLGTALSTTPMADLVALLPPPQRRRAREHRVWERLRSCAHPDLYAAQLDPAEADALESLVTGGLSRLDATIAHFLVVGARAGRRVSALFNEEWYVARAEARGFAVPDGALPFFHWLTVGWERQIVPTPLFDPDFCVSRHPSLAARSQWVFKQYLTLGCYSPNWWPSPTGKHHDGAPDPDAQRLRRPLLLTQFLHRSEDHDLSRTSWLEEGQRVALERRDRFLGSPRVAELVERAAAIEPLVYEPRRSQMTVAVPPYRQGRVHLYSRAESVRRALGSRSHDTVLLVPGDDDRADAIAAALREEMSSRSPAESVLVVATDATPAPDGPAFDLHRHTTGMTQAIQVDLLLDLVRGTEARRVVTIASALGWELYRAYIRQLSARASLGGVLLSDDTVADTVADAVHEARIVEECLHRLDWLLLDDESRRDGLVDRFVLPTAVQQRLLTLDPAAPAAAVAAALDVPRRPV